MNHALASALSHFENRNGELIIGGRGVTSLADEFGTPLYLYDRRVMEWRQRSLREALPSQIRIFYAVKANPNKELIGFLADFYDGFDIASRGEMERVIEAGVSPLRLSFSGPGKSSDELRFAIEQDIGSLSVESEQEIEIIKGICESLRKECRILIRVNPSFELSQSGMKMGGGPKQFGIDADRVPKIIEEIRAKGWIAFEGIHIFAASQNLNAGILLGSFEKIIEYGMELSHSLKTPLKKINLGGGLGIPYFSQEHDLALAALGVGLADLVARFQRDLLKTTLIMELGRFLVGECGIYLTRILYRKVSHNKVFLITDGGMHHHLAASGNLGQSLVRRPMPLTVANKLDSPLERVTVCGRLCTPMDTFGAIDLPASEEGDLIAVMNSGAYGLSASPDMFLSHKLPKEIII